MNEAMNFDEAAWIRLIFLVSDTQAWIQEMEKDSQESNHKHDEEEMMKSKEIEEEIKKTMERNLEVMEANRLLEEQLAVLERSLEMASNELGHLKTENESLRKKWGALKKVMEE